MSLSYLNPNTLASALLCAWEKQMKVTSDKESEADLYNALTDSVPTSLSLDTDAATYSVSQVLCDNQTINNLNGLNEWQNDVTLTYSYTTTTSTTHTLSESVTEGQKFSISVNEGVTKEDAEFSLSFTFTSTVSETSTTSDTIIESITVQQYVPIGHVYEVVLTGEIQTITIPFTCVIQVTGYSSFAVPNNNYSYPVGEVFGWIAEYGCAGDDSSSYSKADGGNVGYVTLSGSVTMSQVGNFLSQTNDVTANYTTTT